MDESEKKQTVLHILEKQNALLDRILSEQMKMRQAVNKKNWEKLQEGISNIQALSASFAELDQKREGLVSADKLSVYAEVQPVLTEVRGKLVKSKVENKALGDYVQIAKGFVQGVLDKVVPQRRNTLYSRQGEIVKPQPESVVINKLF